MLLRRSLVVFAAACATAASAPAVRAQPTANLPARLTDQEYWRFITDMSEPGGYFRSENLLSNETGYQMVIPGLLRVPRAGKVYLGVGPEQNYTYINALKPRIAIIFDVRRGNLLEHLMYKALFELSADRAEFVSRLFTKPRPRGLDTLTTGDSLMNAYWNVHTIASDTASFRRNRNQVIDHLTKTHGFPLTKEDIDHLLWIYDEFYAWGPSITYSTSTGGGGGGGRGNSMPSYWDITTARDGAGLNRGFLATEANWRYIKDMHTKNLIIPVMGNFGGPKAIASVGRWLKDRNAVVTAFYASNVEQYLWQDGLAYNYYRNVGELPIDSTSVIIRSSGGGGGGFGGGASGMRGPNLRCSIQALLNANRAGAINSYQSIFNYCEY